MNKTVFPALLVATIMVAGAFAFMPVEQASTVHTSGSVTAGTYTADSIKGADVAGSNALDTPVSINSGTGTDLVAVSATYDPIVSSQGIVWCTWEGTAGAVNTTGIVTLTTSGDGTILGGVAHNIGASEGVTFTSDSDMWMVTGITTDSTFTCTITGDIATTEIDNISIIALVVPE